MLTRDSLLIYVAAFLRSSAVGLIGVVLAIALTEAGVSVAGTGAVIGAGANVYGVGITSRYIPPFSWGQDNAQRWELEAFLGTAERAMKRRDVPLSERAKRQLTAAWERAAEDIR